jgi:hypothetical protein
MAGFGQEQTSRTSRQVTASGWLTTLSEVIQKTA